MATINQVKQMESADTPLLFFQCLLPNGLLKNWCTHSISLNGNAYEARVLKHNLFDLQLSADDAMDGISRLSLTLANADRELSDINNAYGFKGTQLTVFFAFADLITARITTENTVLFKGIAGDPDEITAETLRLTFNNKLSLHRIALPDVRVQRLCPWQFPAVASQRAEAVSGGVAGRYSKYYRCGYSADLSGGVGNLGADGKPFVACDHTRASCKQRGMFSSDSSGRTTLRFGGFDFVPAATLVRTAGSKTTHTSAIVDTSARYNDPVPVVYGSGWLNAPAIFCRNDGNRTHAEVLLGLGPIDQVLKVIVNDVEVPLAVPGKDLSTTGWYDVFAGRGAASAGQFRQGNFNSDFKDANQNTLGDPYGSMAAMSVVVPNRIASGTSAPRVQVLMQGIWLDRFNPDGTFAGTAFSQNPAWVILDLLRRAGWALSDLNTSSFAKSANFCDEFISATDVNGTSVQIPRYKCNLVLTARKSVADIVRGLRVNASLMLRYGVNGLLELLPERDVSNQQPSPPDGSNSSAPLDTGGWPTYEFSDATGPFSGIVRGTNGQPTLVVTSRSVAETSNRLSVEFQDEENEYQQDSLSVVDSVDVGLIGYEISSQSTALGIANYSQATRVLLRQLDKSTKGNEYVQFQTSFRAFKVRPGDVIAITYDRESMVRQPFRVTKLSPSLNYTMVTVQAQTHDDAWYSDNPAVLSGAGRQPGSQVGVPRPLLGTLLSPTGTDFGVREDIQKQSDGSATDLLTIDFVVPVKPSPRFQSSPLVGRSPALSNNAGTLKPGNYYYGFTSVDGTGAESSLSVTTLVQIPAGANTNSVTFDNAKWSYPSLATGLNVYRGSTPQTVRLVASNQALTQPFVDLGATITPPVGPPDASFDHANFYYRAQYTSSVQADIFGVSTIGWSSFGAVVGAYSNRVARIVGGTGIGQERSISSNTDTTITVAPAWSIVPDTSSIFVVVDSTWHLAAISATSPVQIQLPYVRGNGIQISGRAANVANLEGAADLCPMTHFVLGLDTVPDHDVPGAPNFVVDVPGGGNVTVSNISFGSLQNTAWITSATLNLFYWNELNGTSTVTLASGLDGTSASITLSGISVTEAVSVGDVLLIDSEMVVVVGLASGNVTIARGALTSVTIAHAKGSVVLHLSKKTLVVPFAMGYFEQRSSMNYLHSVYLPDARIYAAQMYMSNAFGDGQPTSNQYVSPLSKPLRSLSGGQLSLQVNGYLAVESNAAPPLLVAATHAVRDARATVGSASAGSGIQIMLWQDGVSFCSLVVPPSQTVSNLIDGLNLPLLKEGSQLTMSILQVGTGGSPGRDLTVSVRL